MANLVPVDPAIAREAGFRLPAHLPYVPVYFTRAAYEDCVAWSDADYHRTGALQDEQGRLWDVLRLARGAIDSLVLWLERSDPGDIVAFTVYRIPRDLDRSRLAELEDDGELAQPVRLVVRRGAAYMVIIDLAEAVA